MAIYFSTYSGNVF